jgi:poly(A) polymerase
MSPMTSDPQSAPEATPERQRPTSDGPEADGGSAPLRRSQLVPRELLDEHAVFVVKRLQREGHEAYLVGGCVRDLLAGLEPKDFDVATDARPNRIKRLFRSARVIGRRFRLVHIRFPANHVIEASTFRGEPDDEAGGSDDGGESRGRRRDWRDSAENIFGTAPEDARRRDFTVNALFYDPVHDEVIDWVGGLDDMERGVIRSIGEPAVRICEDPVRMLRAVHFAQRMDFTLDADLEAAIVEHAARIEDASHARLYIELVKMLSRGRGRGTFHRLHDLGILGVWLPELVPALDEPAIWPEIGGGTHEEASRGEPEDMPTGHATWNLLGAADQWGLAAHQAPESLALAMLFGPWLATSWRRSGKRGFGAFVDHVEDEFRPLAVRMSVPRWASTQLREILWLQHELAAGPDRRRTGRIVNRPAFPAALAYFELALRARDHTTDPADTWRTKAEDAGVYMGFDRRPRPQGKRRGGGRGSKRGDRGGARRGRGSRSGRGRARKPKPPPQSEAGAWQDPPES